MKMNPIVSVEELRKTYGTTTAVDNISFEVREGEIFGIVGPNGAGKTTTIECLEGLRKPDSGRIQILGKDPKNDSNFLKLHTGMQLQQSNLPDRMKVWEALDLYSTFYPNPVNWQTLLQTLGISEKRNTVFSRLSGGQKQRLFIALALLPDPKLIFLDELTTGLDPQARHAIWDLIREVRSKGKTILLTTHFMEEAERLCDRVAILDHGQIVALDTPAALIRSIAGEESITFHVDAPLPVSFEQAFSGSTRIEQQGDRIVIHGKSDNVPLISTVVNRLTEYKIKFRDLSTAQANLEDVFLALTGRQIRS
jgi:ABC-2 type transport system ATP-binding protein